MIENIERKKFLAHIESIIKHYSACDKKCAFSSCSELAILSHVYQNNKILSDMSDDFGELMEFRFNSIFQAAYPQYKSIHRNKVLAYHGFCQPHDTKLFLPIEPLKGCVDWCLPLSQQLIAYRTICREIYVANLGANIYDQILKESSVSNPDNELEVIVPFDLVEQRANFISIIRNLAHYRDEFESALSGNSSSYCFYYHELPFRLEICIAATIAGTDKRGPCFKYDYQEMNVVNIFPYNDKTIIILGYDTMFDNIWINNLQSIFSKAESSEDKIEKAHYLNTAIIDILLRTDFHCMSTKLYNSLDKEQLDCFLELWNDMRNEYSFDILSRNSLFYKTLRSLL